MPERLQKYLARAGVASRRKCEDLITQGKVEVDGKIVTELGTVIDGTKSRVKVNGELVSLERPVCILLHKPVSYVTTVEDPEGRRTVMDLLDGVSERVYPVGRLDYETSGLVLFTNDGDLTYRLLHPKFHVDKRYRATVLGMPEAETLHRLREGIELEDGKTAPAELSVLRHHPKESVIEITIHEGRNRQVRRMFEAIDHPVKRLKRIAFGPLDISQLASGHWRYLTPEEVRQLYEAVELDPPPTVDIMEETRANRGAKSSRSSRLPTSKGGRGRGGNIGRSRSGGGDGSVRENSHARERGRQGSEEDSRNRGDNSGPAMKTQARSNSYGADRRKALGSGSSADGRKAPGSGSSADGRKAPGSGSSADGRKAFGSRSSEDRRKAFGSRSSEDRRSAMGSRPQGARRPSDGTQSPRGAQKRGTSRRTGR